MGAGSRRRRLTLATGWLTSIGAFALPAALVAAVLSHPARTSGAIVSERGASSKVSGDVDAPRPAIERLRRPPNPQQGGGPGPAGPSISLATYLGSDLADGIVAVESDASGNVLVFGTVPDAATWIPFVVTPFFGPQPLANATDDCYLAKFVPDATRGLLEPAYFAIIHDSRRCDAMAVAPFGDVYIARTTADSAVVIEQFSYLSAQLTRTNSFDLPHLARLTHLRVDDQGNSYAVGECANESSPGDLWPLPNGFQTGPAFFNPACVDSSQAGQPGGQYLMVKAGPQGQVFHGSFFGFDASTIEPTSVELDAHGRLHIAGHTNVGVGPTILTTVNAFMLQPGDAFCTQNTPDCEGGDAFLIVFDTRFQGNLSYAYASYLGGTDRESDVAMALAPDGRVHLVGTTQSATTFPGMGFSTNTAIFDLVIDPNQAPVDQLIRSGTIIEGLAATLWYSHESGARFRLRPDGTYALLASSDDPSFPLVEPLFDDPRDPNAFGEMKARLLVYNPVNDDLVLSTYLDDVTLAHRAHLASAPGGTLYVGMLTTETGRSTTSAATGQDDVLLFGIDGIGAPVQNSPPVAVAPADQTIVAGTRFMLYGGLSFDPDGDPLTYTWTEGANVLSSSPNAAVELRFTPGTHLLTLTVDDGRGGSDSATMTLTVLNNTPDGGAQTVSPPDSSWNGSSSYLEYPVAVNFANVISPGFTSLTSRYQVSPVPPPGMQFGSPPLHYDLATTAGFVGTVQVCVDYRGQSFARPDADVRLYQQIVDNQGNVTWVLLPYANDTAARSICGTTQTLGTFALFTPAVPANEITLLAGQPVFTQFCTRNPGLDPNEGGFAPDSNLCNTRGLAFDAARNYLYFAESGQSDAIRRIDLSTNRITTVAGTGFTHNAFDGPGGDSRDDDKNNVDPLTAPVNQVLRVALDPQGNLILAEYGTGRLRKVDFAQNLIYTIADVSALTQPSALAIDSAGAALFSSFAFGDPVIWRLTPGADGVLNGSPDELLQVVAGNGTRSFDPSLMPPGGIDPLLIPLSPYALAFGPDRSLYVTGQGGASAVVRITPGPDGLIDGVADTAFLVAGGANWGVSGPHLGDGGPATDAVLLYPTSIAVVSNGDVYVGDAGNSFGATVRRISAVDGVVSGAADEIITTVAGFHIFDPAFFNGNNLPYSDGDGHALSSIFSSNWDLLAMPNGNLLVNDLWQIRRIGARTGGGDTAPPVLTLPGPIVTEAEGPNGAVVTFPAAALDDVDGPVAVACSPQSGSLFGFAGSAPTPTTVTCSATDRAGNTATGTFTVTVQDTTPPATTPPPHIVIAATQVTGARANVPQAPDSQRLLDFLAAGTAADAADPSPVRTLDRVVCGDPSMSPGPIDGSTLFNVGRNCFELAFADASGNRGVAAASFDVAPPIGGDIHAAGVPIIATDLNNVPQPVTAEFFVLQQPGLLTATTLGGAPPPPSGMVLTSPAFDIRSTALAPTAISVCITLPGAQAGDKLFLFENGTWLDRTGSVDVTASRVCGLPTSLGIYATARLTVVAITVAEQIVVSDTSGVLPSAMIGITEQIVVTDAPAILPSAMISVTEQIAVTDAVGLLPSAMIGVTEQIVVSDAPQVEPQAVVTLTLLPPSGTHAIGDQATITAQVSDSSDEGTRVVLTANAGAAVRVQFVNPGVANSPLSVLVTAGNPLGGSDVILSLATSATGALSSTAAQVVAALNANPASAALLGAQTWPGNPGQGLVRTQPLSALTSVYFSIEGAATSTETCLTSVPGVCSISYTRTTVGTDQVSAYVDVNANGISEADEPTGFALSTWFDDVAPILSLPTSITAEAETPGGATVTFAPSTTDNSSAPVNVTCSPASGSLFPFNGSTPTTTTVNCTATDAAGNVDIGDFTVVVQDTTAPQVLTAQITVAATEAAGARGNVPQAPHTPVLQQLPLLGAAIDAGDSSPARVSVQWVACGNPALVRGPIADTTLYPVGVNCYSWVFRDASGNVGTGIGTIEVSPPIGGHIDFSNVPVTATDLNNVPLPVTATFLGLDQPGLLTAVPPQFIPQPPAGLIVVGAPFELRSTALTQAPAVVCMRPPSGQFVERLLVLEQGQWVDWTESIDAVTGEICGRPRPLGAYALARRDVAALTLTLSPSGSVVHPAGHPINFTAVVSDSSALETRVAIRSLIDLNVEFRNPQGSNSPLSLIVQHDAAGFARDLIVSLATGPAGDLRSTAADVANLINVEAAARIAPGIVLASVWPETRGEGIAAPLPLLPLVRLDFESDQYGPMPSCIISTPGICPLEYTRTEDTNEFVFAHLDLNRNGVRDGVEPEEATFVIWDPPPVLRMPGNFTVPADGPAGGDAHYGAWATEGVDVLPAHCSPVSGTIFPIGTTTVTCTAEDALGNVATGSFTITVVVGTPSIDFRVMTKGRDASGAYFIDYQVSNWGTGHARNVNLTNLAFKTLMGSGTVTYDAVRSGPLPRAFGHMDVSAFQILRIYLNVPSTVKRFSITESGSLLNVLGSNAKFSAMQAVIP